MGTLGTCKGLYIFVRARVITVFDISIDGPNDLVTLFHGCLVNGLDNWYEKRIFRLRNVVAGTIVAGSRK